MSFACLVFRTETINGYANTTVRVLKKLKNFNLGILDKPFVILIFFKLKKMLKTFFV